MQHGQVAGVQPAVGQRGTGGLGVVQVAFHHGVAPHYQFAKGAAVGRDRTAGVGIQHRGLLGIGWATPWRLMNWARASSGNSSTPAATGTGCWGRSSVMP